MSSAVYVKYELLRTFRNRRFVILSLGFPLVLYFLIAAANRHVRSIGDTGISAPLYFMVSLAGCGCMNAVISAGARIAAERSGGWNRQLRLTPLSTRNYFRTKVLTGYVMALSSLMLLYIAGSRSRHSARPPAERRFDWTVDWWHHSALRSSAGSGFPSRAA